MAAAPDKNNIIALKPFWLVPIAPVALFTFHDIATARAAGNPEGLGLPVPSQPRHPPFQCH